MDRSTGRYNNFMRRQGQQNQSQNHYSTSSSSTVNNNHNYDNHRNNSTQYSTNNSSPSSSTSSSSYASHFINREPLTQHDELIRYIKEAWHKVNEQGTPTYHCAESDHQLKNFKPFNLEEYWGQRVVQNLQLSQGNQ